MDEVEWLTPPQIDSSGTVTSTTGFPMTYEITTDVSADSYDVLSGTLPPGLTLNAGTGVISGTPQTPGTYNVTLRATNEAGSGSKTVTFRMMAAIALPVAVEAPQLTWSTGGGYWFGQSVTSHDGVDAAQNGDIGDNSSTWMEAQVTGPGTLTFWWRVDSEQNYDFLRFAIDGAGEETVSGAVDWVRNVYTVDAGTHTVRWTYDKDETVSDGADSAWVDEVDFTTTVFSAPYSAWLTANSLSGAAAPHLANPDGDQFVNLLEYAFVLNPQSAASASGAPAMTWNAGTKRLALTFKRRPANTDLVYEVQGSNNLATWTALARSTAGAAFVSVSGGAQSVTEAVSGADRIVTFVDGTAHTAGGPKRYLRVKILSQ